MNAIQVELLRRYRGGDEAAVPPLLPLDRRHRRRAEQHRMSVALSRGGTSRFAHAPSTRSKATGGWPDE